MELNKQELEDQEDINADELPNILSKSSPMFIIKNYEDFYAKSRIICENSFNLEYDERIDYFTRFFTEFNQSQNRSVFIKRYLQVTLERANDEEMETVSNTITTLFLKHIFTKQQIRRGLDRVYMDLDDIKEDVPDVYIRLAKIIMKLVKDEVLTNQVLHKIPKDDRAEMAKCLEFAEHFKEELEIFENESDIKKNFSIITSQYLVSFNFQEVVDQLKKYDKHPEIMWPWFIRKSILVACGGTNNDREKVSELL